MIMVKQSLSTFARAAVAVAALSAFASVAHAGFSTDPDPFTGNTAGVDLQAAAGTLIPLPGVGPGGITLYADKFHIGNFSFVNADKQGSNLHEQYSADFSVNFLLANGSPAGGNAILHGAGDSTPTQNGFHVTYIGRSSPSATGIFNMVLETATFSGTSSTNGNLYVSLANLPTAKVNISNHAGGGYDITYLTPFIIQGQYTLNTDGSGAPTSVPTLGDVNGQPLSTIPEPSTLLLMVPGLLGLLATRRRTVAA